jgi:HAD superfamily hydrolase (TIGR01509 family)
MFSQVRAAILDGFSTLFSVPSMSPVLPAAIRLSLIDPSVTAQRVEEAQASNIAAFDCGQVSGYERWRAICQDLGVPADSDLIYELARIELVAALEYTKPFPRMVETLVELRRRGYLLALCSNASPIGEVVEKLFDLDSLTDYLVLSHREGVRKVAEDGRLINIARQRTGFPAEQCVFVDDGPGHVAAAQRLGIKGILAVQGEARDRVDPNQDYGQDATITALPQLLDLLPAY